MIVIRFARCRIEAADRIEALRICRSGVVPLDAQVDLTLRTGSSTFPILHDKELAAAIIQSRDSPGRFRETNAFVSHYVGNWPPKFYTERVWKIRGWQFYYALLWTIPLIPLGMLMQDSCPNSTLIGAFLTITLLAVYYLLRRDEITIDFETQRFVARRLFGAWQFRCYEGITSDIEVNWRSPIFNKGPKMYCLIISVGGIHIETFSSCNFQLVLRNAEDLMNRLATVREIKLPN